MRYAVRSDSLYRTDAIVMRKNATTKDMLVRTLELFKQVKPPNFTKYEQKQAKEYIKELRYVLRTWNAKPVK